MELQLAETFAKLVKEVMEQIAAILTDSRKLTSRYGLVSEDDSPGSKLSAFLKRVQKRGGTWFSNFGCHDRMEGIRRPQRLGSERSHLRTRWCSSEPPE